MTNSECRGARAVGAPVSGTIVDAGTHIPRVAIDAMALLTSLNASRGCVQTLDRRHDCQCLQRGPAALPRLRDGRLPGKTVHRAGHPHDVADVFAACGAGQPGGVSGSNGSCSERCRVVARWEGNSWVNSAKT